MFSARTGILVLLARRPLESLAEEGDSTGQTHVSVRRS